MNTTTVLAKIEGIIAPYPRHQGSLLPILREVQHAFGHVPREAIDRIAEHVRITPVQVYGVMTFYSEIRKAPPGETVVSFCSGPACYFRGLYRLVRAAEAVLGVEQGETSPDGRLTLHLHHCNGTCEQAPLMFVNDDLYTNLTAKDVRRILAAIREEQEVAP